METKKSLGQHFLIDDGVLNKIKKELEGAEFIVEIGGGRGALTKKILELDTSLLVVELDSKLCIFLRDTFGRYDNFSIVNQDASFFKLERRSTIVGNLPYNVSKKIIKNMAFQKDKIEKMVFMVQREVADSIIANVNTKDYSKFSVLVQLFFKVRRLFNVKKGAFNPPPRVESSVVEFVPYKNNILGLDKIDARFFTFLNELFQFPRKTIKNNIKHLIKNNLNKNEHFFLKRPRELSIEEMYQLYREVYHE